MVAQLSKIPEARLEQIEAGEKPGAAELVALCSCLLVAPSEFTGQVFTPAEKDQLFIDGLSGLGLSGVEAQAELAKTKSR